MGIHFRQLRHSKVPNRSNMLGFRERIAIILMPWKFLRIPGLFVYGLIPVQPGAFPNNVVANILKNWVLAEVFGYFRLSDYVRSERNRVCFGDKKTATKFLS